MKKNAIIALVLALCMCLMLGLTGCGSSASTSTASDSSASSSSSSSASTDSSSSAASTDSSASTASSDEVYEVRLAMWDSEASTSGASCRECCDMMNEKSGGRLHVTPYFSETLLTSTDHLTGCAQGLAEIVYWQVDLVAGTTPMASMLTLPFTQAMPKSQGLTNAVRELILDTPDNPFQAEMNDMGLTWLTVKDPDGMCIHIVNDEPVYAINDLQGLKLIGVSEMQNYVALGGGNIVPMSPTDYYTSMEKGVVDGALIHMALVDIFSLQECTKSHTSYGTNGGIHCCTVGWVGNLEWWNSLPEDLQAIITECLQWTENDMIANDNAIVESLTTELADLGQPVYEVAEEDMGPWYEAGETIVNQWIEEEQANTDIDVQYWYDQYMDLCAAHMNDQ